MVLLRDERGVTIIELMVTLALMGILTAIAIPVYMSQLPSIRIRSASQRVASVLSLGRMAAVSSNVPCRVVFAPASGYYYAFLDRNLNSVADAGEIAATRLDVESISPSIDGVRLPNAVSFGAATGVTGVPPSTGTSVPADGVELPSNTLVIDPRGTTNASGNVEAVYLRNSKGECRAIRVTYSGMVNIYQWTGSGWK